MESGNGRTDKAHFGGIAVARAVTCVRGFAYVGHLVKLDCALLRPDHSFGMLRAALLEQSLDGGGLEERKRDAGRQTDRPRKQNRFPDEPSTAWSFPRIAGAGPSSSQVAVPALNPRATCNASAILAAGGPSRNK